MGEPAIRVAGLTKRFVAKTAVDGLTLTIGASEGTVAVRGFAPTAVDVLRSRVGVLPQDAILPASDRVGEFLLHMARLQDLPRDKALEAARGALADVDGAAWWEQRCGSLSHGMAKRVALAQAFLPLATMDREFVR